MDLSDIVSEVADQERGAWFDIADPVTGEPTGIRFKIAGPDSETQHRAQLALADELTALAGPDGMVSAEQRERARIAFLRSAYGPPHTSGWYSPGPGDSSRMPCGSAPPRTRK